MEIAENQALFLRADGHRAHGSDAQGGPLREQGGARRPRRGAGVEWRQLQQRFVDIRGFKTLSPARRRSTPQPSFAKGRGEKDKRSERHDEHAESRHPVHTHQPADERRRQRLLGKFAEIIPAKAGRLLALRAAYDERVTEAEASREAAIDAEGEVRRMRRRGGREADGRGAVYLARMDAGQATLQRIDVIRYIATAKAKPLRVAVLRGLHGPRALLHDVAIDRGRRRKGHEQRLAVGPDS